MSDPVDSPGDTRGGGQPPPQQPGGAPPESMQEVWRLNYFNYFTEVEEHFQRARGTALFLLSPLDWALIEGWKNAGIPLEAVLRGIDNAFEKWRARRQRGRAVNSLAYCAQAVTEAAEAMANATTPPGTLQPAAPFSLEELRAYLSAGLDAIRHAPATGCQPVAAALEEILAGLETHYAALEALEQRLTALEEKMVALARISLGDEQLLAIRQELEQQLRPYRGKMSAPQLAMLEKQYLDRRILQLAGLPRLSLYYLK